MQERAPMEHHLPARLAGIAPLFVGYGLLDGWSQITFSQPFFAAAGGADMLVRYLLSVVPALILLLLSARIPCLVRRRYREVLYLFGLMAAVGTALLLMVTQDFLGPSWSPVAWTLLALARPILVICWIERLCDCDLEDLWVCLALAMTLGAVVSVALTWLPDLGRDGFTVALPLISTALLHNRRGSGAARVAVPAGPVQGGSEPWEVSLKGMFLASPWLLVAMFGLTSIPSEALVVLELDASGTTSGLAAVGSAVLHLSVNLAAIALAYVAARTNVKRALYVAIPVILACSVVLALELTVPVGVLHTACRIASELIHMVLIYVTIRVVRERSVGPVFASSLLVLAMSAGTLLGYLAAVALAGNPTLLAFLFVMVLVFALLLALLEQNRAEFSKEAEPEPLPEQTADDFARAHGLTQREQEVMALWSTGHTTAFIEEQLFISKNTVKTHIKHIYEKTGVSSKEELIQLLEAHSAPRP